MLFAVPTPTPPFQPQAVHEDGTYLRMWPDPLAARQDPETGVWESVVPVLRNIGWSPHIDQVRQSLPWEVRRAIEPVPRQRRWAIVQGLGAVPDLIELGDHDLVLTILISLKLQEAPEVLPEVREHARGPRRRLLRLVGLPAAAWVLRVLRRVGTWTFDEPDAAALLRQVLQDEDRFVRRVLHHARRVDHDLLQILADPSLRGLCLPSLLLDEDPWGDRATALRDIRDLRAEGQIPGKPRRFSRMDEVDALLDDLADRTPTPYPADGFREEFAVPVGACSLFTSEPRVTLRPLRTAGEIQALGAAMRNCLAEEAEYAWAAYAGTGAMYEARWHDPELGVPRRACVWCSRDHRGWDINEVELAGGHPAPAWLVERLQEVFWPLNAPLPSPMAPGEHLDWLAETVHESSEWEPAGRPGEDMGLFEDPEGRRAAVVVLDVPHAVSEQELLNLVESGAQRGVHLVVVRNDYGFVGEAPEGLGVEVILVAQVRWETGIVAATPRVTQDDRMLALIAST